MYPFWLSMMFLYSFISVEFDEIFYWFEKDVYVKGISEILYEKVLCCHIICLVVLIVSQPRVIGWTVIRRQKSKCVNVPEIVHAICKKHSKHLIES